MEGKKTLIELKDISKSFGHQTIIDHMNLEIKEGEFLTLLGPSGCGKTTMLRMINGFEHPDTGAVLLEGEDQVDIPPNKRQVNTVFQSYALFPHLTVRENIGFALRMKKTPKDEIESRVNEVMEMTDLETLADRKPSKLSGGQKQRVAIARSLINKPKVLLLDEPLGALDLKLRKQMQLELRKMQRRLGITYVYVTHDQEEALTISDRIVVLNKGKIEQIGEPWEIYHNPQTEFVVNFLGESNCLKGTTKQEGDKLVFLWNGHKIPIHSTDKVSGESLYIRPEYVKVSKEKPEGFSFSADIEQVIFLGQIARLTVRMEDGSEMHVLAETGQWNAGDNVYVFWDPKESILL